MKQTSHRGNVVEALTLSEMSQFCRTNEAWLIELVEHGAIDPEGHTAESWRFTGPSIVRAKRATRLHRDLGVNAPGLALILDLLEDRDRLLRQMTFSTEGR